MRKIMLALALGSAALSFGSVKEASAYDYPYCLVNRDTGVFGDCRYASFGQCMAAASGRGASCNINPAMAYARGGPGYYADDGYAPPPRRRYRREYVPY